MDKSIRPFIRPLNTTVYQSFTRLLLSKNDSETLFYSPLQISPTFMSSFSRIFKALIGCKNKHSIVISNPQVEISSNYVMNIKYLQSQYYNLY